MAISSAHDLRTFSDAEHLEACLYGILTFYLPAGTPFSEDRPTGDIDLRDEMGLDSLSLAEAMFKIEEIFDIRVENPELVEIATLSDARELLTKKLTATSPDPGDE